MVRIGRLQNRLCRQHRSGISPRVACALSNRAERWPRRILVRTDARQLREVHQGRWKRSFLQRKYLLLAGPIRRRWPSTDLLETGIPPRSVLRAGRTSAAEFAVESSSGCASRESADG